MVMNTIEWHENCLKNQKLLLLEKKKQFVILQDSIEKDSEAIDIYDDQIRSARITGKKSFDNERYKIKKPCKTTD